MKKLFGGINLTWPKLIIFAIIAGVFTALMAIFPIFKNTSFNTITVSLEVWILFGIIIIMNSKSNIDSALKCFVFFLISQPLVYLLQVPFSSLGWGIFGYYRYRFIWTILCLPMGYIGYYMKKDNWLGYLILFPMIIITALSYMTYLSDFLFYMPKYILISLFCALMIILYPILIFDNKNIKRFGLILGCLIVIALTIYTLFNPPIYSCEIMSNGDEYKFDNTYSVNMEDPKYGNVEIRYMEGLEDYVVYADFKRAGDTILTVTSPSGEIQKYNLHIERNTYSVEKIILGN